MELTILNSINILSLVSCIIVLYFYLVKMMKRILRLDNRRILRTVCTIAVVLIFYRCSWVEDFILVNNSETPISIIYELDSSTSSFPIFDYSPEGYKLLSSQEPDWNNVLKLIDEDSAILIVKVELPAKSVLSFGRLQNDHYKKYNQYFINARKFNLKTMRIKTGGKEHVILPETFDSFFKKNNGYISYMVN